MSDIDFAFVIIQKVAAPTVLGCIIGLAFTKRFLILSKFITIKKNGDMIKRSLKSRKTKR